MNLNYLNSLDDYKHILLIIIQNLKSICQNKLIRFYLSQNHNATILSIRPYQCAEIYRSQENNIC